MMALKWNPSADISIGGKYTIPRGTPVQMNLYAVHHDPVHWVDPVNFRPDRFLNKNRTQVVPDEWLQPFGYGNTFYFPQVWHYVVVSIKLSTSFHLIFQESVSVLAKVWLKRRSCYFWPITCLSFVSRSTLMISILRQAPAGWQLAPLPSMQKSHICRKMFIMQKYTAMNLFLGI